MREAKQLHAQAIAMGLLQNEFYLRKIITLYSIISNDTTFHSLNHARLFFDQIQNPSTFIFNTMIRAYAASPTPLEAITLYNRMQKQALALTDKYTIPFLLKACANLPAISKTKETHSRSIKLGFDSDLFVQNSLINAYGSIAEEIGAAHQVFDEMSERDVVSWTTLVTASAKFGSIEAARKLFDEIPERNVVSFSAMIAGYVQRSRFKEALSLFRVLQFSKLEPNDSILVSLFSACANLGALDLGRWVHSYMHKIKGNQLQDSRISTSLIDMYSKCGSVETALFVFKSAERKGVGEWTAMISGLAMHGLGEKSIQLFEEMKRMGIKPIEITLVAVLSACTHSGLVEDGLRHFNSMKTEFGLEPTIEHFGCIVDLLGRAGLIDDAIELIGKMPMKANSAIWGALFTACRIHGNVEVGELVGRKLIRDEPWNGALYMGLLDLYTEIGRWGDAEKVKKEMKENCCKKSPGCSVIELNGVCYEFVVGEKSQIEAVQVSLNLGELVMEEMGKQLMFTQQ